MIRRTQLPKEQEKRKNYERKKKLMKSMKVCGYFDDNIYIEILSRLPVKSLLRFKSVSKGWQSIISNDNYFIDLHLSRTNTRSSASTIFMVMLYTFEESSVAFVDLFNEAVPVIRWIKQLNKYEHVLKPVNGLICSYYNYSYLGPIAFCICNVMTQEETPWIIASIEERIPSCRYFETLAYGFGFDLTTKEHKVICIWRIKVEALGGEAYLLDDVVCQVTTVGRKNYTAWRTIDEFPPYRIQGGGIFVGTSLYWLSRNTSPTSLRMNNKSSPPTEYSSSSFQVIVVFDVASEKFRSIHIPNFILDQPERSTAHLDFLKDLGHPFGHSYVHILEVERHIALADQVTDKIVKLWIFDEDGDSCEKVANNTSVSSRDGNWIEETILMPFCPSDVQPYLFESITGTNQLVIGISMPTALYTLYLYDRKNKTFMEVEISGMPRNIFYPSDQVANFTGSLLPVPKKQKQ